MASDAEKIRRLIDEVRELRDAVPILAEIRRLRNADLLTESQTVHLFSQLLHDISSLADFSTAREVIKEYLIPLCLANDKQYEPLERNILSACRKLLADWIDKFPSPDRDAVRDEVCHLISIALSGENAQPACWTVSEIGYRSDTIVDSLWALVDAEQEIAGTAISTIVSLGVSPGTREKVLSVAESKDLGKDRLAYVLSELAGPDTLAMALALFPSRETEEVSIQDFFHVYVLSAHADANPNDERVQDAVHSAISELRGLYLARFPNYIFVGDSAATHVNAARVITSFLETLTPGDDEKDTVSRTRVYSSLQQCQRPKQLEGWRVPVSNQTTELLRKDACLNTENLSRFESTETRLKELAWETALNLGHTEVVDWLDLAVREEVSGFAQANVMKRLASLAIDALPDSIVDLITSEYDFTAGQSAERLSAATSATRLAQSASTVQAFEALLRFGVTRDRRVLLSTTRALGDVACGLLRAGNPEVSTRLFEATAAGAPERWREAAVSALHDLASNQLLHPSDAEKLWQISTDRGLDRYVRGYAIEAIALMRDPQIGEEILGQAVRLAGNSDEEELSYRALQLLAIHGGLETNHALLTKKVGLVETKEGWRVRDDAAMKPWSAFVLGLLFRKSPARFAACCASVLRASDHEAVTQLLDNLRLYFKEQRAESEETLAISQALVSRIHTTVAKTFVDARLFGALAEVDAAALIHEAWERTWNRWHPDARLALAESISQVPLQHEKDVARALSLVTSLLGDASFAVRRTAYRVLSRISPEALGRVFSLWAQSSDYEERKRAAEAVAWVPESVFESTLVVDLLSDRERDVRSTTRTARGLRWQRKWADQYLDKVSNVQGVGNEEILTTYRYGSALGRIGDDAHRRKLLVLARDERRASNVRYWFKFVADQIEARWRDVTRKWPQPHFGWEGMVEEVEGEAASDEIGTAKAHLSLWYRPQTTPSSQGAWGGALWFPDKGPYLIMSDYVELRIPGRRPARALVSRSELGGLSILTGTGPYPSPE